jgi:threonine 3-dehydrogenase
VQAIAKARPEPGLDLLEVPEPSPGPGEVKLRIERGSVCGTDLHIYKWDAWASGRIRPPRVIGHEVCGTIVELGPGVEGRAVGQRVCSESHIVDPGDPDLAAGLGHVARSTRILGVDVDGGFAPYACLPAANARPVPSGVPPEVASMMDALGNAVHTVMDGPVEGRTVLVTGLGPIGLFAVRACAALGAASVIATEVSAYRRAMGEAAGARVVDPLASDVASEVARLAPGGVDACLEMSGHPSALALALQAVRPGGRLSLLGVFGERSVGVDMNQVVFKGLKVHGIVGRKLWQTWEDMEWLLTEKRLDVTPVVTHRMHYTEFEGAMQTLASGEAGKIVLEF